MFGTYCRLNVHVFASWRTVVRAANTKIAEKCRRGPAFRAERKRFYRQMLDYHRDARALVQEFRL